MNNKGFDCGIVGGGLAGLTLAVQLADAGYSVIMFEKEKYPFHRVCGEYISMESFDFLERIGIPLSAMHLPIITEVKISAPDGNTLQRKLDLGGFGISRYTLDANLAVLARKKGVTLMEETRATDIAFEDDLFSIKTDKHTFQVKVACGAYGKRSLLDNKLKRKSNRAIKNYIGVKYHVKLDLPDNRIELHNFKDGYCGVSKVDGDKYCICYMTHSQNLRDHDNDIKAMEENVVLKNPYLKKYFLTSEFLSNTPLIISQIAFGKKSAVEKHVLMMGDAAGTIAPLCGNGMSMAMRSAFVAFQLIKKYLDADINRKHLEELYTKKWSQLFSDRIQTGKAIQYFFGREKLTSISIKLLNRIPALADKLIGLTHGNRF